MNFTRHDWTVVLVSSLAVGVPIGVAYHLAGGLPDAVLLGLVAVGLLLAVAVTDRVERKHH